MKLSDYVVEFLSHHVNHIFGVTGGGAMHLDDSARNLFVPMMHEQAAAIAAEAYSRISGMGAIIVTNGMGGTNAITGVAGAWCESTPMFIISGQVKRADMRGGLGVRQYGLQELDIIPMVSPITKYAVTITDPHTIRYHMEKALHLATSGRPGPVWIDIPLDVQSADIDPKKMLSFEPDYEELPALRNEIEATIRLINASNRPVILLGNGARNADIVSLVSLLDIPVLSTWNAMDILSHKHPRYFGSPGAVASRGSNFIIQNADLIISIGARLDFTITGFDKAMFAPRAKKILIDIDAHELQKMPADIILCGDARTIVNKILLNHLSIESNKRFDWIRYCNNIYSKYAIKYKWTDELPISEYDIIIPGSSGVTLDELWLSVRLKIGQRMFSTMGLGSMGFAIPSAIGACLASGKPVLCIDGDGSFQLNIQELETVSRLKLPIKFYYLNNGGYRSIQITQDGYFGRRVGSDFEFPNIYNIAECYGVDITEIEMENNELPPRYKSILHDDGTQEVNPLENMYPFLPDYELKENML